MSIGVRVKIARKGANLSLRALAERAGISAQAISKYERDLDIPSSGVLIRLAEALGVKVEYFFRTQEVKLSPPLYRCVKLTKKQEEVVDYQIREWLERYLRLENFLPPEGTRHFSVLQNLKHSVKSLKKVEEIAVKLREAWDLGTGPIESMVELLEDQGIKVGLVDGHENFDACTFWMEATPIIAVKRGVPGNRQRFSLGHELGHILLDPNDSIDVEKAMNRFAGAFLVPANIVWQELGNHRHSLSLEELCLLKHKYGLSMAAWIHRAKDLEIISESMYVRLAQRFRSEGWHKKEPFTQISPEEPKRMERLALRSLAEGIISETRAAELLDRPLAASLL